MKVTSNMPPSFTVNHLSNSAFGNVVLVGKMGVAMIAFLVVFANLLHVRFFEHMPRMPLTEKASSMPYHVSTVFYHGSKIEMPNVATWRIPALMKNPKAIFDFSMYEQPSHSMRHPRFVIQFERAMSCWKKWTFVWPTIVWASFIDVPPKPFWHGRPSANPRFIHVDILRDTTEGVQ